MTPVSGEKQEAEHNGDDGKKRREGVALSDLVCIGKRVPSIFALTSSKLVH